ncbi:MAG: transporter [Vicinamibacterales bacterium]
MALTRATLCSVVLTVAVTTGAAAQTPARQAPSSTTPVVADFTGPLASFLPSFFNEAAVIDRSDLITQLATGVPSAINHTNDFVNGLHLLAAPLALNRAIATQSAQFPVGSSSGGFVFGTNPATGALEPITQSFGPAYSSRALTVGKRQFNFGFSYQRTKYDAFHDLDLDGSAINVYVPHNNCCGPNANATALTDLNPDFERDIMQQTLSLELRQSISTVFANVGVTDRFDIGFAVPFVKVDMDARMTSRILRTATSATPAIHSFDGIDLANMTLVRRASATGLGDLLVRAKVNAVRGDSLAVGVAVDLRLPTGDKEELLGSGATQAKALFLLSGEYGKWSPHVNVGYTKSSGDASATTVTYRGVNGISPAIDLTVPDEVNYTAGIEMAATPWMTFGFDTLGRAIMDTPKFGAGQTIFPSRVIGSTGAAAAFIAPDDLTILPNGTLHQVLGVAEIRVHLGHRLLLTGNMLFPLVDHGLRQKPRPTVGFDYIF